MSLVRGRALRKLSPESLAIFEKGSHAPDFELSPSEAERLKDEGAYELFAQYRDASRLLRWWNLFRRDRYQSALHKEGFSTLHQIDRALGNLRTLSGRKVLAEIYASVAREPDRVLDAEAMKQVRALGLEADLSRWKEHAKSGSLGPEARDAETLMKQWDHERLREAMDFTYAIFALPVRTVLGALGMPAFIRDAKMRQIARKILENPNYEPQEGTIPFLRMFSLFNDRTFIHKWGLEDEVARLKMAAQDPATREKYRKIEDHRRAVRNFIRLAAGYLLGILIFDDEYMTVDESYDEDNPRGMHKPDPYTGMYEVELIFNAALPQVTIRIDGNYYVYGDFDVPAGVSLLTRDEFREKEKELGSVWSPAHRRIKLHLTGEQYTRLTERLLLKRNGTKHVWFPPFSTGHSVANEDLREATGIWIPPVFDRSQAGTIFWLRQQHLLSHVGAGDKRVGESIYASRNGRLISAKAWDTFSDAVEAAFYAPKAWWLWPTNAVLDHTALPAIEEQLNKASEPNGEK